MTQTFAPSYHSMRLPRAGGTFALKTSANGHAKHTDSFLRLRHGLHKQAPSLAHGLRAPRAKHGDYFEPAPVRDVTDRSVLHEAIRDNKVERVRHLIHGGFNLEATDSLGQTALHYAAARDFVNLVQLLLEHGANPAALDNLGDTPMHSAARTGANGATWLLAKYFEECDNALPSWPPPGHVEEVLANHKLPRGKAAYAFFDWVTEALSGTTRDLNNHEAVLKYVGHLMSLRGAAAGRVAAEGWEFDVFLCQRLRSLVSMYYRPATLCKAVRGTLTEGDVRDIIKAEIQGVLRSLAFARHMENQPGVGEGTQDLLRQYEARAVLQRLQTLPLHEELTLPLGTSTHAIYVNLRPAVVDGTAVITLRLDNLGWGLNWGQFYLERDNRVAPYTLNIPCDALTHNDFQEDLESLFGGMMHMANNDAEDIDLLYAQLANLGARLTDVYGDETVHHTTSPFDVYWKSEQSAGNCVLKNHSVGIWARLGLALTQKVRGALPPDQTQRLANGLWRAFKECETELTLDRLWNFVITPNAFRERDCASKTLKLQHLLRDKRSRENGLVTRFLNKPNRTTIGQKLSGADLTLIVTDGDVQSLQELIARGVDLTREVHYRVGSETLLHWAVRSSAPSMPDMVKLLVQQGVPARSEDALGRTPYQLAASLRNAEALMALLQVGVAADHGPTAIADIEQCLKQQLADTAHALALLQTHKAPESPVA